jgi:hypothetical protein
MSYHEKRITGLEDRLARLEERIEQKDGERLFDNEVIMAKVSRLEEKVGHIVPYEVATPKPPVPQSECDKPCLSDMWVANFLRRFKQGEIDSADARDELMKVSDELVNEVISVNPSKEDRQSMSDKVALPSAVVVEWFNYMCDVNKYMNGSIEVWDKKMFEAIKRVLSDKPTQSEPKEDDTIRISRRVAERWLKGSPSSMETELRRAIGK